jgi:hypothetical protein
MISINYPFRKTVHSQAFGIKLPSVEVYNIETLKDKEGRTLKHMIKLNHAEHAILFNQRKFHNHLPHHLGSAYLLKSNVSHLEDVYEEESKDLDKWEDSPGEISKDDWRYFLGRKEYQRAFVDFFEDQLVENGYDWHKVVEEFLLKGKKPLINNLISGCELFTTLFELYSLYQCATH